jgi:integrase
MPRPGRDTKLTSKTARARLAVRPKPVFVAIGPKIALGYRKNRNGPGTWVVRGLFDKGARGSIVARAHWTEAFGKADDHDPADGAEILDYESAIDRAKAIARARTGGGVVTLEMAIAEYECALKGRGGNVENAGRLRPLLPESILKKPIAKITTTDLRGWRDGLVAVRGIKPSSANRNFKSLRAALNQAARDRGASDAAWRNIARLPENEPQPNRILSDTDVRRIVAAARKRDPAFGLLIELLAVTGTRLSQLERLEVIDFQDGTAPRLMMPSSRKGRGRRITRSPVPVTRKIAARLRRAAAGRQPNDPLIPNAGAGARDFRRGFTAIVDELGLDGVTAYALRHTAIVRMLKAGVPVRITAAVHDSSAAIIESVYSRHIATDSDAILRRALVDFD